jgi:hypothetical protein
MTENTDPNAGTNPPQNPPATPPTPAPVQTSEDKRFAVYDTTFKRFVGAIHPSRKAAQDAAKEGVRSKAVRTFEIREV